jgi:hypothetical protein
MLGKFPNVRHGANSEIAVMIRQTTQFRHFLDLARLVQ